MDTIKLLLEFSAKTGVAGRESEAAAFGRELLAPFGKTRVTPLGSVVCSVKEPVADKPHVMLDAHIDEIGLVVTFIEDSGFLRVAAVGGVDRRLLLASQVTVHAERPVAGVICSIPPHIDSDDSKNKKPDEIYVDIGAESKQEAEKLVKPGNVATLDSSPHELLNGVVSGKSIDDRAGCVSLIKALEFLRPEISLLDVGLTVVFSSMEEVGGGPGAKTAAFQIAPTHAVAVDVSFACTPDSQREKCGEMKKGPMIGFAPILESTLSERLCGLAEENGIPYQREVMGGRTGTNADQIAASRAGVRTALVSIPQKYMHTPIEAVAACDVDDTGKLIAAYIRDLSGRKTGKAGDENE